MFSGIYDLCAYKNAESHGSVLCAHLGSLQLASTYALCVFGCDQNN
jgi:hypothetical protein